MDCQDFCITNPLCKEHSSQIHAKRVIFHILQIHISKKVETHYVTQLFSEFIGSDSQQILNLLLFELLNINMNNWIPSKMHYVFPQMPFRCNILSEVSALNRALFFNFHKKESFKEA